MLTHQLAEVLPNVLVQYQLVELFRPVLHSQFSDT